jgi:hypothetical protein
MALERRHASSIDFSNQSQLANGEVHMARLTFKYDETHNSFHGPKALGSLIVKYWHDARGKTPAELQELEAGLKAELDGLFNETQDGSVEIKLVHDDDKTVHIAIPKPADDLNKYAHDGHDEAFGNAIVFACGRVQPLRMISETPSKVVHMVDARKDSKAA